MDFTERSVDTRLSFFPIVVLSHLCIDAWRIFFLLCVYYTCPNFRVCAQLNAVMKCFQICHSKIEQSCAHSWAQSWVQSWAQSWAQSWVQSWAQSWAQTLKLRGVFTFFKRLLKTSLFTYSVRMENVQTDSLNR